MVEQDVRLTLSDDTEATISVSKNFTYIIASDKCILLEHEDAITIAQTILNLAQEKGK